MRSVDRIAPRSPHIIYSKILKVKHIAAISKLRDIILKAPRGGLNSIHLSLNVGPYASRSYVNRRSSSFTPGRPILKKNRPPNQHGRNALTA